MDRTAERVRLLDYGFCSFYKKRKNINVSDRVESDKELIKIAKKIWEVTAENLIEREGGVVLDNVGYFCHWMTPKKKVFKVARKGGMKLMPNYHSGSYFYNTTLFTDIFHKNFLKGWSLDKTFNKNIKKGRYIKLKAGMKYKMFFRLVKRIYTDRFLNKLDKID